MGVNAGRARRIVRGVSAACGLLLALPLPAWAAFQPGALYIYDAPSSFFGTPGRIWEFDPANGENRIFLSDISGVSGMVFTPDGSRLRVARSTTSEILEIDGDGNRKTVLDRDDGVRNPFGAPSIAYDSRGNFYACGGNAIRKFPADGGPMSILVGGLVDPLGGAIGVGLNDDVFYRSGSRLYRIPQVGTPELIDSSSPGAREQPLAIADNGDVYAIGLGFESRPALIRWRQGLPGTRETLATYVGLSQEVSMTYSAFDQTIYIANSTQILAYDTRTSTFFTAGAAFGGGVEFGWQTVAYVPEPATSLLLLMMVSGLHRRR